jgi:hypothetical protein
LLFLLPLANLFNWPMERRNTMQNSNQPNQRVLSRMGARILTPGEAAQVSGHKTRPLRSPTSSTLIQQKIKNWLVDRSMRVSGILSFQPLAKPA